jgi:uncharacterized protein YdiU (UPF0061 family)
MILTPQAAKYSPATAICDLPGLSDPVRPAQFPRHIMRFRNDRWAPPWAWITWTMQAWGSRISGGSTPLPGNLPRSRWPALSRPPVPHYNPDIGDGRGFLFAQLRDNLGRLLDLGTKGSGQTPYSRERRRAADAERRGTRDPGNRNARGAGRHTPARPSR